jgi:hypothetical protein
MNIYTFKNQFEQFLQPAPTHALIAAGAAWEQFKLTAQTKLDEPTCEELSFSLSHATYREGNKVRTDETLFQVYFGRLIDAQGACSWRTAEINFYYRYPMNDRLRSLLTHLHPQDLETAFCGTDDAEAIQEKINALFAYADSQVAIWDALRGMQPFQSSFHFWIQ